MPNNRSGDLLEYQREKPSSRYLDACFFKRRQHGSVTAVNLGDNKKLKLSNRNLVNTPNRFNVLKVNYLLIEGTGLTSQVNRFTVVVNRITVPASIIDVVGEGTTKLHVWFCAYKDFNLAADGSETAVEGEMAADTDGKGIAGVGSITVTIVTDTGPQNGSGEI